MSSVLLLVLTGVTLTVPGAVQPTTIPQAGEDPIVLNVATEIDNTNVLPAPAAQRLDTTSISSPGRFKAGWVTGFDTEGEYLSWRVSSPISTTYRVRILGQTTAPNQVFRLTVDDAAPLTFTVPEAGLVRQIAGTLSIPAGTHVVKLSRDTMQGSSNIHSLELLESEEVANYETRIDNAKGDIGRFQNKPYGLMFQYGAWGYPQSGPKKSIDDQADDFDVATFVSKVQETGAKYVIWSSTWWTYQLNAPSEAIDSILGNSNSTSQRDLIGDIATALNAVGIDFYLYYHSGQDSHLGDYSSPWWQAQKFPSEFDSTMTGDRTTLFENWKSVVSELGLRYGAKLDGWFFDDGTVYAPAPWESLAEAARAGNPSRTLSFSSIWFPRLTDVEDVSFGEYCSQHPNAAPIGGNGVYTQQGLVGVMGQCMYKMESDWGIYRANQAFGAQQFTVTSAYNRVRDATARGIPTTFNLMMYEDGTMSPDSLAVLAGLKARLANPPANECDGNCIRYNDNDPIIKYTGNWARNSGRPGRDYLNDVSYSQINGDQATISFTGTGIRLFMPTYSEYGDFTITLDGQPQGTFSAYSPSGYTPQVKLFEAAGLASGPHVLTVTKTGGSYMQLDAVEIMTG